MANSPKIAVIQANDLKHDEGESKGDIAGLDISPQQDQLYTYLRESEKILIILSASFMGLASPIASSIYFPAINTLSHDLGVSVTKINLTITVYQIFQGLAPSFVGTFADVHGRRPAYLMCFLIYVAANCGLAAQHNYTALIILRCLQSTGSSGTIALASSVVADVSTRAERGKYIGYATLGVTLGPAVGPLIGGAINQRLGWHWIFWVLAIYAGVLLFGVISFFPETCRCVCGDGTVPPQSWNRSFYQIYCQWRNPSAYEDGKWKGFETNRLSIQPPRYRPRPWNVLRIALNKEGGIILSYGGIMYAGYMMVLSTLSSELHERYGLDSLKIGLCYLPIGIGSLTSRWTMGVLLDRNFKRLARLHKLEIRKNRQPNIDNFPIERSRLQLTFPYLLVSFISTLAYGWIMEVKTSLAPALVVLFFVGHFTAGTFSSLNTLIVDVNRESPASASASSNLFRCLLGAGAVALGTPLIDAIGIGWAGTVVVAVWGMACPLLVLLYFRGTRWRAATRRHTM